MTEQEWLAGQDPFPLLDFLRASGRTTDRKVRLFAVGCSRRIWALLDPRGQAAVELAEQYADGLAGAEAMRAARLACKHGSGRASWYAAASNPAIAARNAALSARSALRGESAAQAKLVREIFGNPFRPDPGIDPAWLTGNKNCLVPLAQTIYDRRTLPAGNLDPASLAVLAEVLEKAGCFNLDILEHCRSGGEHVRGCWAIDLCLGKL